MRMPRMVSIVLVIVVAANSSRAESTVTVGKDVAPAQRIAAGEIDHSVWNDLVSKYVDTAGMVDYTKWKATAADVQALDRYLSQLSAATISEQTKRTVKLAFWINAYNAVTVKGILREYPTSSIRNHTARVFGYNIWDDLHLLVAGEPYSLNQIEHEILRKMDEPRIHFAVVCASIGCPRLLNEAYVPEEIDRQLMANAQMFFADTSKFRVDASRKTIYASPILDWFGEDFGRTTAEQMRRIAPLLPQAARELANSGTARVKYLDYDWGLNDQAQSAHRATR